MSDMIMQEEAINMSNEQAVQILTPMRNMMCDQYGCPISDAVFAFDKAIEALSADKSQKVIAQITFDEEKLHEIVKEAVERFKEENEIIDRPRGKWIETVYAVWDSENENHEPIHRKISTIRCSNCGHPSPYHHEWITCPYCDAKMEGVNDE